MYSHHAPFGRQSGTHRSYIRRRRKLRLWNPTLPLLLKSDISSHPLKPEGEQPMPKENDLEGQQDMGGKHGGQKGMPKPTRRPGHPPENSDQGIVRDERGQEQPGDKKRALHVSRQGKPGDPPGAKSRQRG
jgi:hypothetical protein